MTTGAAFAVGVIPVKNAASARVSKPSFFKTKNGATPIKMLAIRIFKCSLRGLSPARFICRQIWKNISIKAILINHTDKSIPPALHENLNALCSRTPSPNGMNIIAGLIKIFHISVFMGKKKEPESSVFIEMARLTGVEPVTF